MKRSGRSMIYYIGCTETLRVKIGFTRGDPYARLASLQTGSPTKLILAAAHPGTMDDERELHERFASSRLRGEWFQLTEEIYDQMTMAVWLAGVECLKAGREPARWIQTGLSSMNDECPLPDAMQGLLP